MGIVLLLMIGIAGLFVKMTQLQREVLTVLAFSSPHCSACTEMYSHLRVFSERREDVQIVMVSQGSAEGNRQLIQEQGFVFPVLPASGWDDEVIVDYKVSGIPFFYVIDGEGIIVNAGFANRLKQLEGLVENSRE
jgi:peroxiredoxin